MAVLPTGVIENGDLPPEIEVRFDMKKPLKHGNENTRSDPEKINKNGYMNENGYNSENENSNNQRNNNNENENEKKNENNKIPLEKYSNWQLKFIHNQLFNKLNNSNRFCPGPHHMTFVRKATFKNKQLKNDYFDRCNEVLKKWEVEGPQFLHPESRKLTHENNANYENYENNENSLNNENRKIDNDCKSDYEIGNIYYTNNNHNNEYKNNNNDADDEKNKNKNNFQPLDDENVHPYGIYLFKDRKTIIKYFKPNFFPPYNDEGKRKIIENVLSKTWDETNMKWVDAEY